MNYFQLAPFDFAARRPYATRPAHLDVQAALLAMAQKLNPGKRLDIREHYRFG